MLARRAVLAGAAGLLCACGRKHPRESPPAAVAPPRGTLQWAVSGDWRTAEDRARDRWRHPLESLTFWGVDAGATVVEFWPGAGWYTNILGPFLTATHGRLYAANLASDDPADRATAQMTAAFQRRLQMRPDLFGRVVLTRFGRGTGPVAPAGSADTVLFLRNLHNWMAAGIAEKAFRDALAALKPGGVLGIEEHRARPGGPPDIMASTGYVQEAYVRQIAQEAGFRFDGSSEINANPKDTKDHPFGVWTLPPTRLSAPRGEPPRLGFDHSRYDAIGESDRMTLRFVKPR